jgi:outer membrane autotransporter protein
VSPGGSIGTLNLAGDYLQASSAVYLNEIDPSGKGDLLNVSGKAQINGGLLIVSAPIAYYPTGASWPTILAAGSQTGAFAAATQDFPSLILRFLPVSTSSGTFTVAYRNPYGAFATNSRAASAGEGLNRGAYSASGTFANDILAMDLSPQAVIASSLNQMHPEPYDAFTQTGFDDGRLITSSIQGRMHSLRTGDSQETFMSPFDVAPTGLMAFNGLKQGTPFAASLDPANRWGVFLQPFGMTGRQGSDGGRTGYGFNSWGMLGGMDYSFSKNLSAGLFGGYTGRSLTLNAPASGNGRTDTVSFGGFATWSGKNWFAEGSVRGGVDSYQAKRTLSSPTGSLKASSSWNGWNLFANIGAGYDWHLNGWILSPIGSVDFARIAQNGYDESGAGSLGLTVHSRSDCSLRTSIGAKVARPMEFTWGTLIPELRMTWGHEWLSSSRDIAANFQGSATSNFTTKTVPTPSDWASVSAGLTVKHSERLSVSARISTDLFRNDYNALAGSLSLRYSF